jgi:hypothetical protein
MECAGLATSCHSYMYRSIFKRRGTFSGATRIEAITKDTSAATELILMSWVRILAMDGPHAHTHPVEAVYTATDILDPSTTAPPYVHILLSAAQNSDLEIAT